MILKLAVPFANSGPDDIGQSEKKTLHFQH